MISTNFYRVLANPAADARWQLQAPIALTGSRVDPRSFTRGLRIAVPPSLSLPVRRKGNEVGFNFCDFDMVVTRSDFNSELEKLVGSAIQRIPVTIDASAETYEILNVCDVVPCFDESRSLYTKWTTCDGNKEKVDQIRMVVSLKIDPSIANGHHIFRVAEWPIALIISQEVKNLFEAQRLSGLICERVD